MNLPRTNFHLLADNPVSRIFWGRVNIEMASSFLFFSKGNTVQHLMHCLKYKNNKEVGIILGKVYGYELKKTEIYSSVDKIIPVPLHPKKLKLRGYNQSEMISKGLSESMGIPVETEVLIKNTATDSQTHKTRFNRWENVSEVFALQNTEKVENQHLLLVDDVVTTGATIESCTGLLLTIKNVRVSLATLACAVK